MPIVSICFFVFTVALLIYSGIVFLGKEIIVPINRRASVKNVSKEYVKRFGFLIMFLSIAPFIAGVLGLFIKIVIIPIISFVILFILLLIIGNKIIIEKKKDDE